jgi:hypothetical protein
MCNSCSIHSSHNNGDSHQSVYSTEISGTGKTVITLVDTNYTSRHQFPPLNNFDRFSLEKHLQTHMLE